MATVYLARDIKHDRLVALKVLNQDLGAVLGVERFLSEIRVTANLQHPHLLPLFDSGEAEGLLYYVMPYVSGESLRAALDREKQLPVADALNIARAVASALDHAHRHGVIHRDLKPENILLHEGQPLVADFGIALAISNAGGNRITQTGISLGTPQYMSPEQATGDRSLDARSDIYSLAAVLYEMLSGEPPHTGSSSQTIIARVLTERPRSLRATRAAVPLHVAVALERALEKLPADRFSTAAEFATVLSASPTAPSAFQGAASRGTSGSRRLVWWSAAVGALSVSAVGGYAVGANVTAKASPFPREWEAEKLNGPTVALSPRISPDGKFVAFEAMEGGQTQVGVLTTGSGEYRIRTHALRGFVQELTWSPDGRIYFSRYQGGSRSVFSILPVEGDERLVLERAADAQVLADNTLLFARTNGQGVVQLYRTQPEREPIPLGAVQASSPGLWGFSFRPFRDGREVVFYGRPLGDSAAVDHLYVLDLASGAVRMLAPGLTIKTPNWRFPLAVSADDRWVLFDLPVGDLHRIVAIPRAGGNDVQVLITLTSAPLGLDVDATGSIYVDQPIVHSEIFRYWPATARLDRTPLDFRGLFPLPDGRYLIQSSSSSRNRIALFSIGGSPEPFAVATAEETSFPVTLIGPDRVALRVGSGSTMKVAVVAIATGAIVSRLATIPAANIVSLAGAPDGRRLYYTVDGFVWEADINGGPPRRICAGNRVAVAPAGDRLLVQRNTPQGNQLVWVHITGGAEERILIRDTLLGILALTPNAVGKDGRIAIRVTGDSWYAPTALLDPRSGRLEVLRPGFTADASGPGWAADGSIVSEGGGTRSALWRFRPIRQ